MSMNLVILEGRLTKPPELRDTPAGTPVCDFSIAVDDGFGDKKKTCYMDITAWANQATFVAEYFKKGSGILIQGRMSMDQWEDKETGKKRTKHKVTAEKVTFPIAEKKEEPNWDERNTEQKISNQDIPF